MGGDFSGKAGCAPAKLPTSIRNGPAITAACREGPAAARRRRCCSGNRASMVTSRRRPPPSTPAAGCARSARAAAPRWRSRSAAGNRRRSPTPPPDRRPVSLIAARARAAPASIDRHGRSCQAARFFLRHPGLVPGSTEPVSEHYVWQRKWPGGSRNKSGMTIVGRMRVKKSLCFNAMKGKSAPMGFRRDDG